ATYWLARRAAPDVEAEVETDTQAETDTDTEAETDRGAA
ncbi:MAG: hypothetical protein QOJ32_208, partial [Frankiaceae bacterium]|nr:hypothetical protein [Frankiaceae bacterium]